MTPKKTRQFFVRKLLPDRPLLLSDYTMRCPWCDFSWVRGGHKEGFVKARAFAHVSVCHEIILFGMGFVKLGWKDVGNKSMQVAERVDLNNDHHRRIVRLVKANARRRKRAGFTPRA